MLTGVTPEMRLYSEESFGPIVTVIEVDGPDEAVAVANDTEYGLSSAVFSENVSAAMELAQRIESGICHINDTTVQDEPQMPFGGVKASGWGRFGGRQGLEEFTELRWITVQDLPREYPLLRPASGQLRIESGHAARQPGQRPPAGLVGDDLVGAILDPVEGGQLARPSICGVHEADGALTTMLRSAGARDGRVDAPAAVLVVQLDRRTAVRLQPAVAPLHQRHQRGQQLGAHLGQPVELAGALARLLIGLAAQQPGLHQLAQPRRR